MRLRDGADRGLGRQRLLFERGDPRGERCEGRAELGDLVSQRRHLAERLGERFGREGRLASARGRRRCEGRCGALRRIGFGGWRGRGGFGGARRLDLLLERLVERPRLGEKRGELVEARGGALAGLRRRGFFRARFERRVREAPPLGTAVLHHFEGRIGQAGKIDQGNLARLGGVARMAAIRIGPARDIPPALAEAGIDALLHLPPFLVVDDLGGDENALLRVVEGDVGQLAGGDAAMHGAHRAERLAAARLRRLGRPGLVVRLGRRVVANLARPVGNFGGDNTVNEALVEIDLGERDEKLQVGHGGSMHERGAQARAAAKAGVDVIEMSWLRAGVRRENRLNTSQRCGATGGSSQKRLSITPSGAEAVMPQGRPAFSKTRPRPGLHFDSLTRWLAPNVSPLTLRKGIAGFRKIRCSVRRGLTPPKTATSIAPPANRPMSIPQEPPLVSVILAPAMSRSRSAAVVFASGKSTRRTASTSFDIVSLMLITASVANGCPRPRKELYRSARLQAARLENAVKCLDAFMADEHIRSRPQAYVGRALPTERAGDRLLFRVLMSFPQALRAESDQFDSGLAETRSPVVFHAQEERVRLGQALVKATARPIFRDLGEFGVSVGAEAIGLIRHLAARLQIAQPSSTSLSMLDEVSSNIFASRRPNTRLEQGAKRPHLCPRASRRRGLLRSARNTQLGLVS